LGTTTTTSRRRRRSQLNNQQNASGTSQRISSAAMNAANLFSDKTSKFAFEAGEVVSKWESIQKSSLDYGVPVDADECIDIAQRIQVLGNLKEQRTKKTKNKNHEQIISFVRDFICLQPFGII
jgi:hypothetical protein